MQLGLSPYIFNRMDFNILVGVLVRQSPSQIVLLHQKLDQSCLSRVFPDAIECEPLQHLFVLTTCLLEHMHSPPAYPNTYFWVQQARLDLRKAQLETHGLRVSILSDDTSQNSIWAELMSTLTELRHLRVLCFNV